MDKHLKYERQDSTGDSGFLSMQISEFDTRSEYDLETDCGSSMKSAEYDTRSECDLDINCDFQNLHIYSQLHANTDGDFDFNDDFLKSFEECFRQNDDGDTELHKAVIAKDLKRCIDVINLSPHPILLDIQNDQSLSALHLAVLFQEYYIVRKLVLAGANTNIRMSGGHTPLHLACLRGDLEGAKALVDASSYRETNCDSKSSKIVPVDLEIWNHAGKTCLHIAASFGHLGLVQLLVSQGANVISPDGLGGMTALHLAIENGHREVVQYLVKQRPECLDTDAYNGYSPYQLACEINPKLAHDLVSLGADPISRSCSESSMSSSEDEIDLIMEQQMEEDYLTMKIHQDSWRAVTTMSQAVM